MEQSLNITAFAEFFFFKEKQVYFITTQTLEVGSYGKMKLPYDFFKLILSLEP